MHHAVKQWRSKMQIVETMREDIKAAVSDIVPADAQHIVRVDTAIGLDDNVARTKVSEAVRSRFAASNQRYEFMEDRDADIRVVLAKPFVENRNEIVCHRRARRMVIPARTIVVRNVGEQKIHPPDAKRPKMTIRLDAEHLGIDDEKNIWGDAPIHDPPQRSR